MNENKIKSLKRLLVATLVFAFVIRGLSLTTFASTALKSGVETETEMDNNTVVIFCEDNNEFFSQALGVTSIPENMAVLSPYSYCCVILSHFPNGETMQSSGILLGKNVVLTCAHGVYDHDRGGNANSVIISVGAYFNSSEQFIIQHGTTTRKQMVLHKDWVNDQKGTADWALVILKDHYIFNSYPRYGYAPDYTQVIGRTIDLVGYPGQQFVFSKGTITGTTDNFSDDRYKGLWTTSATSLPSMSGGPMFDVKTGAVIGVVKGKISSLFGANVCNPITQELNDLIKEYKNK